MHVAEADTIAGVVDALEAAGDVARADFVFWAIRYESVRGHECAEVYTPHGWPLLNRSPAPPRCEQCRLKAAALRQIGATMKDPALRLSEWTDCPIDLTLWEKA